MTKINKTLSSLIALIALAGIGCADTDSVGHSEGEVSGRPVFDVFEGTDSRYYFNFSAANHEIILASQSYSTRTGALAGVLSVLNNAIDASSFRVNDANNGGAYFNVHAANGAIIATSEVYANRSSANRGVETVINNVGDYLDFAARRTGARFIVFENENGAYFFQLRAKNGAVVLRSESYKTEAAALNGTFSVAQNGLETGNFDTLQAASGGFYFNLVATNGQIIGTSEVYSTKSNATRGRNAIVKLLPIVELL